MSTLFILLGMVGFIAGLVMLVKGFIKKTPKKNAFLALGLSFLLFIVGGGIESSKTDTSAETADKAPVAEEPKVEEEPEVSEEIAEETAAVEEVKEPEVTKSPEDVQGEIKSGLFELFCSTIENPIKMTASSKEYIKSNPNLFPANSYEEVSSLINYDISFKHIAKSPGRYDTTFLQASGNVVSIEEVDMGGEYLNVIHIIDDNFDSYYTCYIGELPNVFKGNNITIVGIPLGTSGFSNVSGGTTNIVAVAASRVGVNY